MRRAVSFYLTTTLTIFAVTLLATCAAAQEEILYNFPRYADLTQAVVFDAAGNLYGTTGSDRDPGTVFKLEPKTDGKWTHKVLHQFGQGNDGRQPLSPVIFDPAGHLYGTTWEGGTGLGLPGTVFELTPQAGGGWKEKVVHNFNSYNGKDGAGPIGGLVRDAAGNLYGVTASGGTRNNGTVFELLPKSGGGWTEKVLYSFTHGDQHDGRSPRARLILDGSGNLYGTTFNGGGGLCAQGCGTVFELTPKTGGGWTEKVLHRFQHDRTDGFYPYGGVIFDAAGNLYGTTSGGGPRGTGTVFELTPTSGDWTETILLSFKGNGFEPHATLVFDDSGNLYGTTRVGGGGNAGSVFELTPNGDGSWTEKILHNFSQDSDGKEPFAGLILDGSGNLYGTTAIGGTFDGGTVFKITH
jgi:uncharacterized repeat protein (TIGR03803 family)